MYDTERDRDVQILDVQSRFGLSGPTAHTRITDEIARGLSAPFNCKAFPTILLYDERGLKLYDKITTDAPEYYLFGAEEEILRDRASEVVQVMHSQTNGIVNGEVVVELGAGSLRKTTHILRALSGLVAKTSAIPPTTYFAIDLQERELRRTLSELTMSNVGTALAGKVATKGLVGTFESGLQFISDRGFSVADKEDESLQIFVGHPEGHHDELDTSVGSSASICTSSSAGETLLSTPSTPDQPSIHLLFLGSSVGNFARGEDSKFLRSLPLRPGSGDTLLLGVSHQNTREEIELAYNDVKGHTREFIMNGLKAAGEALGDPDLFSTHEWEYVNVYNEEKRVHEAYYKCLRTHQVPLPGCDQNVQFLENELVKIEVSQKYSDKDIFTLFTEAQLRPIQHWVDSTRRYSLWLLERPPFMFPLLPSAAAFPSPFGRFCVPTVQDWYGIWAAWDFVTLNMIPSPMFYQKPIDLRHICLFYLGHIPTFLDIHLSRLLGEPHTKPEVFKDIFERGIDPNVDDPTQCHDHSKVPENDKDWPSLSSILAFRQRTKERLLRVYQDISCGKLQLTRSIARVLFMTYEHEGLHLETLLYMLIQRAGTGTIPPPGFTPPPWESLLVSWNATPKPETSTVVIEQTAVTIGIDDIESEDNDPVKSLDVTGHAFGWDNESPKRVSTVAAFRIEWRPITNGEFFKFYERVIKDKDGTVADGKVRDALTFPVSWVTTEDSEVQVRTLYGPVPMRIAYDWPVLTSYDNLSVYASVKGGRIPTEPELRVFLDKFESGYEGGSNTGFRNWHPVPATMGLEKDGRRGHNGGVWEWTSTVCDAYEGFVPSSRYPGYYADFFDGAHNVVLGGSSVTIPRLADRRSVRNWYQRNYPYAWTSARVAYDLD